MKNKELSKQIIEEYGLTETQLLHAIGAQLSEDTFNIRSVPSEELIERAREFLSTKRLQLQHAICNHQKIMAIKVDEGETSNVTLITAVADLIASIVVGISPVTVAVLLVKKGLRNLCRET